MEFKYEVHEYTDGGEEKTIIEKWTEVSQAKIDAALGVTGVSPKCQTTIDRIDIAVSKGIEGFTELFEYYVDNEQMEEAIKVLNWVENFSDDFEEKSKHSGVQENPNKLNEERVKANVNRTKRGKKGMTSYGRKMVRSAATLLEEKHGKKNLTFGTLTIPRLSEDLHYYVCIEWSKICRKFFQELSRLLERKGLNSQYVQVTEIQVKRLKKSGVYAPHLHYIHQGRKHNKEHWRISPSEIKELWQRILENELGQKVDCSKATRIERIRKSATNYLSKYMSKGSIVNVDIQNDTDKDNAEIQKEKNQTNAEIPDEMIPSSWWGASLTLKEEVKKAIIRMNDNLCNFIFYEAQWLKEEGYLSQYYYVTIVDSNGDDRVVGVSFRFSSKDTMRELFEMFME